MANFAIHDGTLVYNVIVADSKEAAEELTGLQAIETDGTPWVDWVFVDGQWVAPVVEEPTTLTALAEPEVTDGSN